MKQKLSITIDQEKVELIEDLLKQEQFRSKSHLIEYLLNKFLQENLK
jgi:Arc/MetJ-type ribon-helix-helix transcriptional regulator